MMKNNMKNDNLGSIGIGAMIVFIALILVAAVQNYAWLFLHAFVNLTQIVTVLSRLLQPGAIHIC